MRLVAGEQRGGLVGQRQQAPGMAVQQAALGGDQQAIPFAIEQGYAELSFEFAQAGSDVRRHAMQLFGRGCDGAAFDHRAEESELREFHIILFK